jgi:hypothetical protein
MLPNMSRVELRLGPGTAGYPKVGFELEARFGIVNLPYAKSPSGSGMALTGPE